MQRICRPGYLLNNETPQSTWCFLYEAGTVLLMRKHKHSIRAAVAWIAFFVVIFITDPLEAPLIVLMLPFVFLFVAIHQTLTYLLQRLMPRLSVARRNAVAIPGAFLPVSLMLLNSVQQLTLRDIVLLAVLLVVAGFYIRKSHIFNQ